jgi:predicted nucleic acid-binding protein
MIRVSRGLVDTSVLIARETGRRLDEVRLPDELAVSVITIGELRAGVLAASDLATRDRRLGTLTAALELDPVPVDDEVASHWARLRVMLRDHGQRMPVNDSWIAATAIALGVPVVTQDDDYPPLPGLAVIQV